MNFLERDISNVVGIILQDSKLVIDRNSELVASSAKHIQTIEDLTKHISTQSITIQEKEAKIEELEATKKYLQGQLEILRTLADLTPEVDPDNAHQQNLAGSEASSVASVDPGQDSDEVISLKEQIMKLKHKFIHVAEKLLQEQANYADLQAEHEQCVEELTHLKATKDELKEEVSSLGEEKDSLEEQLKNSQRQYAESQRQCAVLKEKAFKLAQLAEQNEGDTKFAKRELYVSIATRDQQVAAIKDECRQKVEHMQAQIQVLEKELANYKRHFLKLYQQRNELQQEVMDQKATIENFQSLLGDDQRELSDLSQEMLRDFQKLYDECNALQAENAQLKNDHKRQIETMQALIDELDQKNEWLNDAKENWMERYQLLYEKQLEQQKSEHEHDIPESKKNGKESYEMYV